MTQPPSTRSRAWIPVLAGAAAALLGAMPAAAQSISGRVLDDRTGEPLAVTDIALVDSTGSAVVRVVSDTAGYFRISAQPGRYRLRSQRIGYTTTTSEELLLREGEPVVVELRLAVRGIPIEPLIVEARGREQGRHGFMRRRELGIDGSTFLTPDSIDLRYPREVSDAFRAAKGIDLREHPSRGDVIRSMRGQNCIAVFVDHYPHPFALFGGSREMRAQPRIALGFPRNSSEGLNMFYTDQVLGVEVYPSYAEVPEEMRRDPRYRDVLPCGIALVWTGRGW